MTQTNFVVARFTNFKNLITISIKVEPRRLTLVPNYIALLSYAIGNSYKLTSTEQWNKPEFKTNKTKSKFIFYS